MPNVHVVHIPQAHNNPFHRGCLLYSYTPCVSAQKQACLMIWFQLLIYWLAWRTCIHAPFFFRKCMRTEQSPEQRSGTQITWHTMHLPACELHKVIHKNAFGSCVFRRGLVEMWLWIIWGTFWSFFPPWKSNNNKHTSHSLGTGFGCFIYVAHRDWQSEASLTTPWQWLVWCYMASCLSVLVSGHIVSVC